MKKQRTKEQHEILRVSKLFQRKPKKRSLIEEMIPLQRRMNRYMYDLQHKIVMFEDAGTIPEGANNVIH